MLSSVSFPRILPFALFMSFIGLEELARILKGAGLINYTEQALYLIYPVKAFSVGLALLYFRSRYSEINHRDFLNITHTGASILTGLLVFVLWVNMDWPSATFGSPNGYNPAIFEDRTLRAGIIISRLMGAVVVVPVMEELFWRSFLIRYIIKSDFIEAPIGQFTWASFLIATLLFGLEHNLWLAGLMAGIAYNLLLYRTKSISHCIMAHAVTNLALGLYVLYTGEWQFW